MTSKKAPAAVNISLVLLYMIAAAGVLHVSYMLSHIWTVSVRAVPIELGGRTIIYCVVPVLAIADMMRGNRAGRYLGILSMMSAWGLFLRLLRDPIMYRYVVDGVNLAPFFATATFSIVVSLAALILTLGFSKKVDAYFEPEPPA
jgi:hypothetical protein